MDALYQLSYRGNAFSNVVLEVGLALSEAKSDVLHFVQTRQGLVLEVGLEPTKPEGERFTVSCHCH